MRNGGKDCINDGAPAATVVPSAEIETEDPSLDPLLS